MAVSVLEASAARVVGQYLAVSRIRPLRELVDLVGVEFCRTHQVVPLWRDGGAVAVASARPRAQEVLREIRERLGQTIVLRLSSPAEILIAIDNAVDEDAAVSRRGAFALVLTAIVADSIRHSLLNYDDELTSRLRVIDELEAVETATGTVKRSHADRMINSEVERSRRYGRSLTLVVLGPDDWSEVVHERGAEAAEKLIAALAQVYIDNARSMDHIIHFSGPDFAALLPETSLEGGQVVAEKFANIASDLVGTPVRAGIAGFPEDDVTGTGLVAEAEEALSFARIAQITVASRSLLT